MNKNILLMTLVLSGFAELFSGVTVYNKTPYNIRAKMWWAGGRGGNNEKSPLYLGPGQNKKMTGDSWDVKKKYRVEANVYGNDYTDLVTERGAYPQAAGNQTIDILIAADSGGNTRLVIAGHTK